MENTTAYKKFNKERDVLYLQTIERDKLFRDSSGKVKPYTGASVSTITAPAENPAYYTPVDKLIDDGSQATFFSTAQGINEAYASASGSSYMFHQMKQLTRPKADSFTADGTVISKIDVIALSREFYKDAVDPNYFCAFINTATATPTTSPVSFSKGDGILGLYAGETNEQSLLGKKRYLYPTTSTATLYNPTTDELTMVAQSDLDKSVPFGEVYLEAGLVILFTNVIESSAETTTIDTTSTFNFLAGIVGRSEIQLNSELYYIRMYNQDFNYTNNPTFYEDVNDNIIKSAFSENPTTYVTTVGLYNDQGDLIAVGKLSKPIEKNFEKEAIIHAQLSI